MKDLLSLCMIVKDEENTLGRCLKSVKSLVDEIIIVDTGSIDSTKEIARKFNAKIYDFKWVDDFSLARNFAFSKANRKYTMWLDADDYITEENIIKVRQTLEKIDDKIDYISARYVLSRDENGNANYSLRRNRIVKTSKKFKWIGKVHEYLEVYGNGMQGEFSIEHGKIKNYTNRNLNIFREMESRGEKFSVRDSFYYANELRDNKCYEDAIKWYNIFLDSKQGWIEDIKTAYVNISECYKLLGNMDIIPEIVFESFKYDTPRADICCMLGEYYMNKQLFQQATFWYRVALDCKLKKGSMAIDYIDYHTWVPSLQLCLCYYNMGRLECAYFFNELAATFNTQLDKIEYNRKYFINEFKRLERELPQLRYPLRLSDYIEYQ